MIKKICGYCALLTGSLVLTPLVLLAIVLFILILGGVQLIHIGMTIGKNDKH